MRTESIAGGIEIRWWDERKGRASISDRSSLNTLLDRYQLPNAESLPFAIENDEFVARCMEDDVPCTVVVERKPQGPLQVAAWAYAEESGMARIESLEGEMGVRFLDEDRFIPFTRLHFDPARGFEIVEGQS